MLNQELVGRFYHWTFLKVFQIVEKYTISVIEYLLFIKVIKNQ